MSVVNPHVDRSSAEEYEKHLVPRIYAPWAEFVVGRANPSPVSMCWMWRAAPASAPASQRGVPGHPAGWSAWMPIPA